MILIAGGTGTLGRHLIDLLAPLDEVRVLTRDPAGAAGLPVQPVPGDVRDADAVAAAVRGCSTVISAVHGFLGGRGAGPEAVDRDGNRNLIDAATRHGVDRFVLVSVMAAAPDHPMRLHRMKYAAEQSLRATRLAWTIVRPSAYLQTWIDVIGAKLAAGGPAMVFGRGDNPINFVSARDVAAVIATVAADPAYTGVTVNVAGPDNITFNEFARQLAARHRDVGTAGPGRVKHISPPALRIMSVLARPISPALARQAAAALVMDTTDMTCGTTDVHRQFPGLRREQLGDVVTRMLVSSDGSQRTET
jgi:uncharacterized protein YbjT (DUF2867 family)